MTVREDCRHYLTRTLDSGDIVRRCRLDVAEHTPFACPEGCLFWESRPVSGAGWTQAPETPMSNTAANLPPPTKRKKRKGGRSG